MLQGPNEVGSFCVFFRPGMANEVLGGMSASSGQTADNGPDCLLHKAQFAENLRPHDDLVTPALVQFACKVQGGLDDLNAVEEALQTLLLRMLRADRKLHNQQRSIASTKASTRAELLKRVNWAADFIRSNYKARITLDDIAAAASLSKFHLVRLFRQVHGATPHQYLVTKRLAAANRMLARADLDLSEIAALTGFGSRWSLFRHLRKKTTSGDCLSSSAHARLM